MIVNIHQSAFLFSIDPYLLLVNVICNVCGTLSMQYLNGWLNIKQMCHITCFC